MSANTLNHPAIQAVQANPQQFTPEFMAFLPANIHVYTAFEREARRVIARGFKHYSSKTILEVLRHHSALEEAGGQWKLNNNLTAYLARLYSLLNPDSADLFEFRVTKAAGKGVE